MARQRAPLPGQLGRRLVAQSQDCFGVQVGAPYVEFAAFNPGSSAQSEPHMCHVIGACQPLSIPKRTDYWRINGHTGACSAHGEEREGEEGKPSLKLFVGGP